MSHSKSRARDAMSLNRAIRISGAVLFGLMLLCGATGIAAAWMQAAALNRQTAAAALFANHEAADMMHDAIRSDVLASFQATEPGSALKSTDILNDFRGHLVELRKGIAADSAYTGDASVAAVTSKLAAPMEAYVQSAERLIDRIGTDPRAARAMLPGFFDQFRGLEVAMGAASDAIEANSQRSADYAERVGQIAMILLVITLAIGIAGTIAFVTLAVRRVVKPIIVLAETMRELGDGNLDAEVTGADRGDELGDMAMAMLAFRNQLRAAEAAKQAQAALIVDSLGTGLTALADGDLTAKIDADLHAPFTGLKDNFNSAIDSLRGLIGSVAQGTTMISTGSQEIAQASEDLARRTEGNAASLEETAAAIAQMDQRLQATAVAAGRTVERADGAITTVAGGREIADEAVQAMTRVSESAKGIDSVIEGLDKIAFQTRVLAMNAAVEAGRAGEAGRGFAVVADLVSALAMRAEEEAGRARDQLTATQADIGTAVERVQRVDGALSAISADVRGVHTLLAEIAGDNRAQSTAITDISTAVTAMDQATQQNAAMVEQTSAAARNLTSEVAALTEQAAKFRIGAPSGQAGRFASGYGGSRAALRANSPQREARMSTAKVPAMADAGAFDDDGFESF
ncbi:Chemotaxis protein [Sphingomonas aurantiaca]|uniref:Chemotaxis protein n=1 Tax=Sphingomonas aurantiaca TaxID=185949 RepID=A0A5E7YVJ0_9SPHN|nr:methyl-accepting chemotaxis protein [Sphingomonas aurantiaca]VVT09198.1 Chemotaxis protein [Sphingomonas aurantiaca]